MIRMHFFLKIRIFQKANILPKSCITNYKEIKNLKFWPIILIFIFIWKSFMKKLKHINNYKVDKYGEFWDE